MNEHAQLEVLLACHRDLSPEQRARVSEHLKACRSCAARLAGYAEMDRALAGLEEIQLPARLERPLSALLQDGLPPRARSLSRPNLAFARGLMPAGLTVLLLVVLSLALWSAQTGRAPTTATPTLTLTLTPTLASVTLTQTALHVGAFAPQKPRQSGWASTSRVPSPAPVPAPRGENQSILLAAIGVHATIIP